MTGPEATAVALRLAVRLIDGADPQRIRDLMLTTLFDSDGADGVLDVATAAVGTLAELTTRMGGPEGARVALLAAVERCEAAPTDTEVS